MAREGTRRLAAVWFADIVGYSALSASDADRALAVVEALQRASEAAVPAHRGRIVKRVGDAVLAVFGSVEGALRAALDVQASFNTSAAARQAGSALRIGLHIGEVTEAEDGDVYGDGVNVASRLQGRARPGQIAVSHAVKELLRGRSGFVVSRAPAWHLLKGIGPTRVYTVSPGKGAPPPPLRRVPSRAIAAGLSTAIVGFVAMMMFVASDPGEEQRHRALAPEELRDGGVLLDAGIDGYFAGELEVAVASLEPFAAPPLLGHPDAQKALRFLARAQLESGRTERARAALARLFAAEPPFALLIPSAEDERLLALYHEVRRENLRHRSRVEPTEPIRGVVVFDLEVVLPEESDPVLETLGPSVAQMMTSELEEAGVAARYFWELMVGFTGEGAYARFHEETDGEHQASHALLGRVAVRGDEVSLAAQVYDVATGTLAASEQVTGDWPDALFGMVEDLGARLSRRLAVGSGTGPAPVP